MGIVKGNNEFGEILTGVRDEEVRRRAASRLAGRTVFPNVAAAPAEVGATAMIL